MPDVVRAYTALTGRTAPPPLWALGLPPVPLVPLHAGRGRGARRPPPRRAHPVRRAVARHRAHGRLPRVHVGHGGVPGRAGHARPPRREGLPRRDDRRPGREARARRGRSTTRRVERDVLCRTEGGDVYLGEVWPGDTAFPDFVTEEGARVVGRPERRPRALGRRRDLERHERAGDRPHPAGRDALRPRPRSPTRASTTSTGCSWRWGRPPACSTRCPTGGRSSSRAPGSPASSATRRTGWATTVSRWDHLWLSIPMAMGLGLSGQAFVGADVGGFVGHTNAELFLRWMQYGTLTPFCRNHSEIGNADQYAWTWGETIDRTSSARRSSCATGCCPTSTRRSSPRARRARRCSGRSSSTTRTTRPSATSTTSTCFGADLLVAPVVEAGMTARQVYLPAGGWYDWHTGEAIAGRRLRARADADGPHPDLRARGRGRPDVARGAAVDRRPPSRRRSSCTSSSRAATARTGRSCRRTTGSRSPPATARGTGRRSRSRAAATA